MFTGSTKNSVDERESFLKHALEARQAREMKRRQANAVTKIQAFYRSYKQRIQLRHNLTTTMDSFKATTNTSDLMLDVYRASRELMFIFNPIRDKQSFDIICNYIINSLNPENSTAPLESLNLITYQQHLEQTNKINYINFASIALNEELTSIWFLNMKKILHECCNYLAIISKESQLNVDDTINYIKMIDLFTSTDHWKWHLIQYDHQLQSQTKEQCDKLCHELLQDLVDRAALYERLNLIMTKVLKRSNAYHQQELVEMCTKLTLKPLIDNSFNRKTTHLFTINIMRIPCLIHHLERISSTTLNLLHEHNILRHIISNMMPEQDFRIIVNSSEVNPTVSLLANLVHFAMTYLDNLKEIRCDFVIIVTKILEHFKGYVVTNQSSLTHWHPILGWFSQNVDSTTQESMEIVKSQLYYLWNIKFIKILFTDTLEANELYYGKNAISDMTAQPKYISQSRSSSKQSVTGRYNYLRSSLNVDASSTTSFNFIKKVVERATSTMNKSIGNNYMKSSSSSGPLANNKLLSPSTNSVALVCYMYHTCLNTLTEIKRDILAGLCLHDFVLPNLWHFIRSLGPNNGLKAFLDHLTIYTKTNAPEFHIVILFCECATHLISILDDTEVYEKQKPFCLDDLIAISGFLNNFVFRVIWNNLITQSNKQPQQPDTLLTTTHTLLTVLYKRDCRRNFTPANFWLIKDIKISSFLKDLETGKSSATTIMKMIPHVLPHKERVLIFRRYVSNDKAAAFSGPSTQITIHRSRVVENGYQQLARLPPNALKGLIRVKFINEQGLDEAGVDQDGVFKEFLEDTIKRVFDPTLNLFKSTSEQRLYPSPTSHLHRDHLSLFEFVGKMLGKAVYEGIVVDVPFASFFLSQVLGQQQSLLYSWIDELPSLDPELYKSLTYIKHYEGDVSELELTFSIDQDILGKIVTYELEPGGRSNPVTKESRVKYIHSVAKFRMHRQIHEQTAAFIRGFRAIINPEWISMFSTPELQRLISGDNNPIDIADLRKHTKYFGGFHSNHRVINWLWDILEKDFNAEEHRMFLKFITSCSKPPLLGFANLEPPFTIRCVEVSDDQDLGDTVGSVLRGFFAIRRSDPVDRLPTSSTCFNLLKLPNYQRRSTLREKLRYAIRSNAGFELS